MLASSGEQVRALNEEAQLHRINQGKVRGAETVNLYDGMLARRGDVVLTRRNDRRLRAGRTDFVKNGDVWRVEKIAPDGSLRVRHTRTRVRATLPPEYLGAHTELGYASTVHRAQGLTADTCHALLGRGTSRDMLYTAVTRGRLRLMKESVNSGWYKDYSESPCVGFEPSSGRPVGWGWK